ncbi:hypothetical protein D3C76_1450730 [compost metagenome]
MTGVPSPVLERQYVQMAIRYIEADDATDPQHLHAHLLRHPFALRASLHHDKFGQPIHRSCDRHGYVLLACGADDDRKAFNAAISHPLLNTQGQVQ